MTLREARLPEDQPTAGLAEIVTALEKEITDLKETNKKFEEEIAELKETNKKFEEEIADLKAAGIPVLKSAVEGLQQKVLAMMQALTTPSQR